MGIRIRRFLEFGRNLPLITVQGPELHAPASCDVVSDHLCFCFIGPSVAGAVVLTFPHPENRIILLPRKAKTPPFFSLTRIGRSDARRPPGFRFLMGRSDVGGFLVAWRWCLK